MYEEYVYNYMLVLIIGGAALWFLIKAVAHLQKAWVTSS